MSDSGHGQKLDAGAKMRYKQMIDAHNAAEANKKKNKKKKKNWFETMADKLYGGNS